MTESIFAWAPLGLFILLYIVSNYFMTKKYSSLVEESIEVARENTEVIRELTRELEKIQKYKD
ncbi:hypothetical protein [Pseudomonas schmalbachii]|uniref:Uncharacterized protein n=1 Tax=Pseudomonas schmalbachii TaxID=2816993 RepID=A0ABS3TIX0_9PSED|nr:hypothetical protein [Pseudomonas schmalbachii]MBO3273610.1 hypothetical protein [Pseudomonas schmalbachii]